NFRRNATQVCWKGQRVACGLIALSRPLHPRYASRMNAVFADTAYYLALLNEKDEAHGAAVAATGKIAGPMVTTDWILVEVADAMCRPRHRGLAAQFIRDLRRDPRVTIIPLSSELLDRGFHLYCARLDKD